MVEYPCWIPGCAFEVTDAPHIDACVQQVREHFRGAHPTKYLNARDVGQQAQRYNQTFEEYMTDNLGAEWANFANDVHYYASTIVRERDGQPPLFRKSTVDAAKAWIEANPRGAQEVAQDARALRFRPAGRRPRGV